MSVGAATQLSTDETIDQDGHQVYTSVYMVVATTATENPITVRNASGIPAYGSSYSWGGVTNPDAYLIGARTSRSDTDGTHLKWLVTVTHSTRATSRNKAQGLQTSPLAEEWRISGSFVQTTRVADKDRNGRALQNSADEPKGIEVPDGYDTLRLSGPSAFISLSTRAQAINKVNSETIWGLIARQLYLAQWQYQIMSNGTSQYVHNDLEFWIKYAKWNDTFLDEGTREYLGASDPDPAKWYRAIPDGIDGAQSVHLLDGAGRLLNRTANPNGIYLENEVLYEYDFTRLGFPNPLPGPFV
jgi:hypothetical protein